MNYAIGIVAGKQPLTAAAVQRMMQFLQEVRPAPARISFLDWHVPDAKRPANDRFTKAMEQEHHQAARKNFAWYAQLLEFRRGNLPIVPIRPLHERTEWTFRVFDRDWNDKAKDQRRELRPEHKANPAAIPPCWWGKQWLIEDAMAAGCDRILLLPIGGWMAPDAPAMLEAGIGDGVVVTYPQSVIRCDIHGQPLKPLWGYTFPPAITAAHLEAGDSLAFDYWWIDLAKIGAGDTGRVCNYDAGDTWATLTRVLHAGDGRSVDRVLAFHPEIAAAAKRARQNLGRVLRAAAMA